MADDQKTTEDATPPLCFACGAAHVLGTPCNPAHMLSILVRRHNIERAIADAHQAPPPPDRLTTSDPVTGPDLPDAAPRGQTDVGGRAGTD